MKTAGVLEGLFEGLTDGVCVTDPAGRVLYMNRAAERLLGAGLAQMQGRQLCGPLCGQLEGCGSAATSCPVLTQATPAITLRGRHGPQVSYDWQNYKVARHERWQHLRVRCQRLPAGAGEWPPDAHLVIIEDASAELELEKHREDWRSMVAHDLRSPLTSVYATLRALQDVPAGRPLEPAESRMIDIAVRASQRLLELLNLYLDLAKLDAKLMPVRPEPVSLLDIVWRGVEEQEALARERGVETDIDVPEGLAVKADRDLLARVLDNLLNNAIKFSPRHGTVTVAAAASGDGRVSIAVSDRGPGIAEAQLPRLFDRFHQAQARRQGKTQGTGLGLAFCREALAAMGGEISVESKVGQGSSFAVSLPAAPEQPS